MKMKNKERENSRTMQVLETRKNEENIGHPLWRVLGTRNLPVCMISLPRVRIRLDPKITRDFLSQVGYGIIEPVIVRKIEKNRYEIVTGVRRYLAAKEDGSSEIKCKIVEVKDENTWRIVLLENTAREDLLPMDLAAYIDEMMAKYEISQNEVARVLRKDKSTVSNLLRVFHNEILREEVREGFHSLQSAIELETIAPKAGSEKDEQEHFASFVNKTRGFSVSQIRNAIIADFRGKKPRQRCNRCKASFQQEELSDFRVCPNCQKRMGLERIRKVKMIAMDLEEDAK
jgi:ParB/RepB/Spo0J family partition protein